MVLQDRGLELLGLEVKTHLFNFENSRVGSCCCWDKGRLKIEAEFQKAYYTPGETAKVKLTLDASECRVDIKKIQAEFYRVVTIISKKARMKQRTTLHKLALDEEVVKAKSGPRTFELNSLINVGATRSFSTQASLVRCEYFLAITCKSGLGCCYADPKLTYPIEVCMLAPSKRRKMEDDRADDPFDPTRKEQGQFEKQENNAGYFIRKNDAENAFYPLPPLSLQTECNPFGGKRIQIEAVDVQVRTKEGKGMARTTSPLSSMTAKSHGDELSDEVEP